MIVPYRDNLARPGTSPGVYALTALLCVASAPALVSPAADAWVVPHLGFVPILFSVSPWLAAHSLLTATFVHGDAFHLLGNLLFLWVFGRSMERLFGRWPFFLAFPLLGVGGLLVHWAMYPASGAPVIGSSGAIAVLMGAYLALFPRARVRLLLVLVPLLKRFWAPAWSFLVFWGAMQLLSMRAGGGDEGGVAYAVHAGGFLVGAVAGMVWKVSYPSAEERLLEFVGAEFEG